MNGSSTAVILAGSDCSWPLFHICDRRKEQWFTDWVITLHKGNTVTLFSLLHTCSSVKPNGSFLVPVIVIIDLVFTNNFLYEMIESFLVHYGKCISHDGTCMMVHVCWYMYVQLAHACLTQINLMCKHIKFLQWYTIWHIGCKLVWP